MLPDRSTGRSTGETKGLAPPIDQLRGWIEGRGPWTQLAGQMASRGFALSGSGRALASPRPGRPPRRRPRSDRRGAAPRRAARSRRSRRPASPGPSGAAGRHRPGRARSPPPWSGSSGWRKVTNQRRARPQHAGQLGEHLDRALQVLHGDADAGGVERAVRQRQDRVGVQVLHQPAVEPRVGGELGRVSAPSPVTPA